MEEVYYEIEIKEVRRVPVVNKDWKVVADKGNERDGGAQYDYVFSAGFELRTTKVMFQRSETMDMKKVICAVNGIEPKES